MDFVAEKSVWSSVSPLHPIRPVPALTVQLRGLLFTICILLSEDRLLRYEDRDVHSILSAFWDGIYCHFSFILLRVLSSPQALVPSSHALKNGAP